jgi:hypothetical protein
MHQNPTKYVNIAMKLSTQSINTWNNIFNLQKVYAIVHPFGPQLIEQLITA